MSPSAVAFASPPANGHVAPAPLPLGYVDWDNASSSNERVLMRCPLPNRDRIIRDQYLRIEDATGARSGFLGRIVTGPFFAPRGHALVGTNASLGVGLSGEVGMYAEIELLGEIVDGQTRTCKSRPAPRAIIHELST